MRLFCDVRLRRLRWWVELLLGGGLLQGFSASCSHKPPPLLAGASCRRPPGGSRRGRHGGGPATVWQLGLLLFTILTSGCHFLSDSDHSEHPPTRTIVELHVSDGRNGSAGP